MQNVRIQNTVIRVKTVHLCLANYWTFVRRQNDAVAVLLITQQFDSFVHPGSLRLAVVMLTSQ